MCSIWGGFKFSLHPSFQHCSDEAQEAETVLSAVMYVCLSVCLSIYIYILIYLSFCLPYGSMKCRELLAARFIY